MAATWTANHTWSFGEVPTAALMNQYIRDNLDWLKTPVSSGNVTFATDATVTTLFADITGATTTFTTKGGGVDVVFRCTFIGSTSASVNFELVAGGAALALWSYQMATTPRMVTMVHHVRGADIIAGVNTFKISALTGAGTATIYGTTGGNGDPFLYAREAGE